MAQPYHKALTLLIFSLIITNCSQKQRSTGPITIQNNILAHTTTQPKPAFIDPEQIPDNIEKSETPDPFAHEPLSTPQQELTPVTVFVHGTHFGINRSLVRALDCPLGLTGAQIQGNKYVIGKIPYTLNEAASDEFPLKSFYLYGWGGELDFEKRKEAAEDLYKHLKKLNRPITVMGQSHGVNVILHLAEVAQEHNDSDFKIDRAILLAGPVQEATEHLVKSPIFKQVYSFYSTADMMQILDPQGTYKSTKKISKEKNKKVPLLSKRTFDPAPNLIQVRILLDWQGPSHLDFILKRFIKRLPEVLHLVDKAALDAPILGQETHYIVNIPRMQHRKPHIVPKDQMPLYIPRSDRKRKSGQPL